MTLKQVSKCMFQYKEEEKMAFNEMEIIREKQICIDSLVSYLFESVCNCDNEKLRKALEDCHCFDAETIDAYCEN